VDRTKIFIILFIFISVINVFGQIDGEINNEDSSFSTCEAHLDSLVNKKVYTISEKMPEPEGGMNKLYKQLSQKINFSRIKFERIGVELDKIFIGFVVDTDGSIIGKRIIRSIDEIDVAEQMFSVISSLTWTPGYCNKEPVPVILIIPLQICLR